MIIGVDEVGRGAWAGPLVVGAVGLSKKIQGLDDSKKLSPKQRRILAEKVYDQAEFVGIGWAESFEVDDYGLSASLTLATLRALVGLDDKTEIIIDGNSNYLAEYYPNSRCLIKADSLVPDVSAASIVAKVARDQYMVDLSAKFNAYGFDSNVGYGTKFHRENIIKNGLCPEHRLSFKPILDLLNGYS